MGMNTCDSALTKKRPKLFARLFILPMEGSHNFVFLSPQITLAKAANYTTPEIINGVARACPAASNFRTLLDALIWIWVWMNLRDYVHPNFGSKV